MDKYFCSGKNGIVFAVTTKSTPDTPKTTLSFWHRFVPNETNENQNESKNIRKILPFERLVKNPWRFPV